MNVTGRVTVTILLFLNVLGYVCFYYFIQITPLQSVWVSAALVCYLSGCFVIAWRLGKQYDLVKDHAFRDPLTGVFNRRFAYKRVPKLLTQANKKNEKLMVIMFDINNFKMINDTCGHKIGDIVLQKVSQLLMDQSVKGDIVARWGGDEFLFISRRASPETVRDVTQRLHANIECLSKELGQAIGVSMGVTMYPDDAGNLEELIDRADFNMYRNKTMCRANKACAKN